jgi:hypothetical protein
MLIMIHLICRSARVRLGKEVRAPSPGLLFANRVPAQFQTRPHGTILAQSLVRERRPAQTQEKE